MNPPYMLPRIELDVQFAWTKQPIEGRFIAASNGKSFFDQLDDGMQGIETPDTPAIVLFTDENVMRANQALAHVYKEIGSSIKGIVTIGRQNEAERHKKGPTHFANLFYERAKEDSSTLTALASSDILTMPLSLGYMHGQDGSAVVEGGKIILTVNPATAISL